MFPLKLALGLLATALAFIAYYPYLRDIIRKRTKPHAFSWLVWGTLTGIGFAAQIVAGGGGGAWATGITALICFVIVGLALQRGSREYTRMDWLALGGALVAILLWLLTSQPLYSVILVALIDASGFIPTARKAYRKPHEETLSTYVINSFKWIVGILALESYSPTTWINPASLVLTNGAFAIYLLLRRRALATRSR